MAPLGKELSKHFGVLEPLQTKNSIEGQVEELKRIIESHGATPVALVGWSWGAWLGYLLAAQYPNLVAKLILVGSGPFEQKYVEQISKVRLSRLGVKDKELLDRLSKTLVGSSPKKRDAALAGIGALFHKTDSYNEVRVHSSREKVQYTIYKKVWGEAAQVRRSGQLLKAGRKIKCPVVAIHGDYDPHPYKGVKVPLMSTLKIFRFVLLKKCGHSPWLEKYAKKDFYKFLLKELV